MPESEQQLDPQADWARVNVRAEALAAAVQLHHSYPDYTDVVITAESLERWLLRPHDDPYGDDE